MEKNKFTHGSLFSGIGGPIGRYCLFKVAAGIDKGIWQCDCPTSNV